MNQQTAGHARKGLFMFAQSSCMDQQKVEGRELSVYTTSRKGSRSD